MNNIRLFNLVLLLVAVLFVQDSRAQDTLLGHSNDVRSVAFSHDGRILGYGTDARIVKSWEAKKKELIATLMLLPNWSRGICG